MFDIVLQYNESEKNRIDKTLTDIATVSGTLRSETSIIDPVIIVEGDLTDYTRCNYVTIEAFGRSYFVTNIRSVSNDLIEISCHVDVLSSFKTGILSNRAIISRSESEWNLYLNDGSLKSYQDPYILTEPFPDGFDGFTFILSVAG